MGKRGKSLFWVGRVKLIVRIKVLEIDLLNVYWMEKKLY